VGNSLVAQAQANYIFAYASQPQTDGRVYIKTISPANPTTSQILLTVSIPNNAYVLAVTSSPNGKWFAIAYTGGVIRIVNGTDT
jgi:WD40 repeat protein